MFSLLGHGLCGVWMFDARVLEEHGVTFSIGHSQPSLTLCEIGTFQDLKRYRSGIYWGIYSRGGAAALH